MVRRRERQRSLWEVVLPDADKPWPAELRRIDELLDDDEVIEVIARGLETRWPASRRRGALEPPLLLPPAAVGYRDVAEANWVGSGRERIHRGQE